VFVAKKRKKKRKKSLCGKRERERK
jgi:hypothetical protein